MSGDITGVLVVDKPLGITSTARADPARIASTRKVGHATPSTLSPPACW